MSTTTINDVLDGVVQALSAHFPDVDVHDEEVEQNLSPPYFYVEMYSVHHDQELNVKYKRAHRFDIHYHADHPSQRELHAIAEQLYELLETIEIGGKRVRGTNMRHEIVDQELHFFVDYDFLVTRQVARAPKMEHLEQEGFLRE
jgi:Fe-S-cluster formation regulator IscX/YfhJ